MPRSAGELCRDPPTERRRETPLGVAARHPPQGPCPDQPGRPVVRSNAPDRPPGVAERRRSGRLISSLRSSSTMRSRRPPVLRPRPTPVAAEEDRDRLLSPELREPRPEPGDAAHGGRAGLRAVDADPDRRNPAGAARQRRHRPGPHGQRQDRGLRDPDGGAPRSGLRHPAGARALPHPRAGGAGPRRPRPAVTGRLRALAIYGGNSMSRQLDGCATTRTSWWRPRAGCATTCSAGRSH